MKLRIISKGKNVIADKDNRVVSMPSVFKCDKCFDTGVMVVKGFDYVRLEECDCCKEDEKFECDACGLCCLHVKDTVEKFAIMGTNDIGSPMYFYRSIDKNGRCECLTSENKCSSYKDRPLLCRVNDYADYINCNRKEWQELCKHSCNMLKGITKTSFQQKLEEMAINFKNKNK